MLNDFIHLTQGELLIKYWWLWLVIFIIGLLYSFCTYKQDKRLIESFKALRKKK